MTDHLIKLSKSYGKQIHFHYIIPRDDEIHEIDEPLGWNMYIYENESWYTTWSPSDIELELAVTLGDEAVTAYNEKDRNTQNEVAMCLAVHAEGGIAYIHKCDIADPEEDLPELESGRNIIIREGDETMVVRGEARSLSLKARMANLLGVIREELVEISEPETMEMSAVPWLEKSD